MIISEGLNIYPEEIEKVLINHDEIKDVVVVGEKHDILGEIPVAKIVSQNKNLKAYEIIDYCTKFLDKHKIPRKVIFCDKLEKTYTGKIIRKQELDKTGRRNKVEQKIYEALKNVIEDITMDDERAISLISDNNTNLIEAFALDSFLRVKLIIELEEVFGIEIDMEKIDMEIYEKSGKLKEMIQEYLNEDNV